MSFLHRLTTGFAVSEVGTDRFGNTYYESKRDWLNYGRKRRYVVYAKAADPTTVPPEWHCWLHHVTATPLDEKKLYPWQQEHQPNLTGTARAYRPSGHDYAGGQRQVASGDYEAWTPGS
ncbi:putative NADH dehydrogenase [Acetobacteraceae bacterium AT-5844]|nr:putative NADH dehydrogenase [Acetobacteraceae bacterium AT-5844]